MSRLLSQTAYDLMAFKSRESTRFGGNLGALKIAELFNKNVRGPLGLEPYKDSFVDAQLSFFSNFLVSDGTRQWVLYLKYGLASKLTKVSHSTDL